MKTLMKLGRLLSMLIVSAIVLFVACSDPAEDLEDDGNSNGGELTEDEADKISDSFAFTNGVRVTGLAPTVVNTSLVKTDSKDTIYTVSGLKIPLRISHPTSVAINGWFIAVKNSTYYYDVPIHEEEDSDSVSVVIIEIAPEDVELPLDIPVEIKPYDQNKVPVDVIERIVTVEEPEPASGGCDILVDGDTTEVGPAEWVWHATIVFDHNNEAVFVNAPGRIYGASQVIEGCCNQDPKVCPQLIYNPVKGYSELVFDSKVTAATTYSIDSESFTFYNDGTFERRTLERIKNLSHEATDWCGGIAGYNDRESFVEYYGTHNYSPGNASISYGTTRSVCDDPLGICGYGSRGGAVSVTCHMLVILAGVEGSKELRMYRRHPTSEVWFD